MPQDDLIPLFLTFGLAGLIGFVIGLERETRQEKGVTLGIRDFVLFALLGAISAHVGARLASTWIVPAAFGGMLAILLSSYWADRGHGSGVTTETAAILTFFLGVLVQLGSRELAIALTVVLMIVLLFKPAIKRFRAAIQVHEMQAAALLLAITFVVLPVLPGEPLDRYTTLPAGKVEAHERAGAGLRVTLSTHRPVRVGERLELFGPGMELFGAVTVEQVGEGKARGPWQPAAGSSATPEIGQVVRARLAIGFLQVMLSAITPHRLWLIVVLVSLVSFLGYILIKIVGGRAGVALTALIGGLVSSTVTTLSFARRSRETPAASALFAPSVLLASSIMFPRLFVEIVVFNPALAARIALPLGAMGGVALLLAWWHFRRAGATTVERPELAFDNPFSLKSAVNFALLFATILMLTRLATTYLGNAWLPVVSLVSGLTDADAIAFSLSGLHRAGLIGTDWAGFNLVLGALSNTLMKLLLVAALGSRALFGRLLLSFMIVATVGIVTTLLYYDLRALA